MNTAFLLVGGAIVVSGIIWLIAARWLDEDTRRIVASNA
jgi:hypothetical protein